MQIIESSPGPSKLEPPNTVASLPRQTFALKREDLRDLNFIAWAILALILTIAINQSLREREPRDFVYFYSCGSLLNHDSPTRLYDYALQLKILKEVQPEALKKGSLGAYSYPPYVAMFFQPFAMLPYWAACSLWLAISLTLYLAGCCLLITRFCRGDMLQRSLFLWFGLAFWPFVNWILLGGQLSAIGFLGMALAVYWEDADRHFLSGLALSVCTYKPTLLVLILPMLLVIRRPKTLAGFGTGALTLMAAATLAGGPQIWVSYVAALAHKTTEISTIVPVTLDLRALAGVFPRAGLPARALLVCAAGIAGTCLAVIWWRARSYTHCRQATLVWATTMTWTLLLNVYVPVYDSVLALISLIATSAVLIRFAPRWFSWLCLALLVSSYVSTWLSIQIGWQVLTLVLAAIGLLQMSACFRIPGYSTDGIHE